LVLSAPLSGLYGETATFRVTYPRGAGSTSAAAASDLVAEVKLGADLLVNETKWLILNLAPEEGRAADGATEGGGTKGEEEHPPTLRVKARLEGPYRPEVHAVVKASEAWFGTVDNVTDAAGALAKSLTVDLPDKVPALKVLLIPAVPLAGLGVVALPIAAGVLVVGLPFFLPLLVVFGALAATIAAAAGGLYFSTRDGRARVGPLIGPAYEALAATSTGQRFVYETGDRPSPVALAEAVVPRDMAGKLILSLLIDLVGSSSYLLPVVGEAFDLAWAPTQSVLIAAMYDEVSPNLKYVSFAEEILPFTDVIPSATYGWLRQYGTGFLNEGKRRVNDLAVAAAQVR